MKTVVVLLAVFGTLASAEFYSNYPSAYPKDAPKEAPNAEFYSNFPSAPADEHHTQLSCNKEYEYYDNCASPCEETCGNYQNFSELKNSPECSLRNCAPKCKCVSGYVRNNNGRCVPKTECKNQEFHATRGNRQPYFYPQPYPQQYPQPYHQQYPQQYPQQQFEKQEFEYDNYYSAPHYGNQYDAGHYYNDYNKF